MSTSELDFTKTATRPDDSTMLRPGAIVGGRYRIDSRIGAGGMGEVWRAYDLRLRGEIALKAIIPERLNDEQSRELLRREVIAARRVTSPHVCRIFDLFEAEGFELLSMELIDGTTLQEILRERAPLELPEAQRIASQLLTGLQEIHEAGLIHRDLKPSNVMLTRSERVVLMDFGLARAMEEASSSIAGTPAYMAPEQASGSRLGPAADLYSAGIILAEMVSPNGVRDEDSQRKLWRGIRADPPHLPDTPWSAVLRKALRANPSERFSTATELLRVLEEITLRVAGAEHLNPYPGLASFNESNSPFFFGREIEIEQMWRRFDQPRLQALIGPSGSGKSSFLKAGVVPTVPGGWRIVMTTPGTRPFLNLARALAPELRGDEGVDDLLLIEDPEVATSLVSRWRRRHDQALIVIDQFEELFTQNRVAVQSAYAATLARLVLEADTHVLLSMRDDFLFHCASHQTLAPVFSEPFPLRPLTGPALRRALVQPAQECGYRFEDDGLVDEILAAVDGERGALPLMAFAAAQLWDRRDRTNGLLTRQAYEETGGVAGSLGRHAEATLDRIGADRMRFVRELFRNLITAQDTRIARDRDELLSVFPEEEREEAGAVLDALIEARLVTSFEDEDFV